jgi:DNA adenine methylase
MECYQQVRDNCDEVLRELTLLKNSARDYYQIRRVVPNRAAARAARFIYLTKLAFNGIYRVNRLTGHFNVPYGQRTRMAVVDAEHLRSASRILGSAITMTGDFDSTVKTARAGDLVYLDPPYTLAHTNNGFVRYNTKLFSWPDQERLAGCALGLARKGVAVIVTNAPHRSIITMYPGFEHRRLRRPSQIAADIESRKIVTELVLMANV